MRMKTEHGERKGKSVQEDKGTMVIESAGDDADHGAIHANAIAAIDFETAHDQETDVEMIIETTGADTDRAAVTGDDKTTAASIEERGMVWTVAGALVRARVTDVVKSREANHRMRGQKEEEIDHGASSRTTYETLTQHFPCMAYGDPPR